MQQLVPEKIDSCGFRLGTIFGLTAEDELGRRRMRLEKPVDLAKPKK